MPKSGLFRKCNPQSLKYHKSPSCSSKALQITARLRPVEYVLQNARGLEVGMAIGVNPKGSA